MHREFVGGASLPDIIHHAHNGDLALLLTPGANKIKVLFAEYFNPKMIYALIGAMKRPHLQTIVTELEIVVLTPFYELIVEIREHVSICELVDIKFIHGHIEDIFDNPKLQKEMISQYNNFFNYIEFYGPDGGSESTSRQLELLNNWLDPTGVIGYSFYTKNIHVDNLHRMLKNRNTFAHNPFSVEAYRLVTGYLTYTKDLAFLNKDTVLIKFLSTLHLGNISNAFSNAEVKDIVTNAGMQVVSMFPTAFANPFGKLLMFIHSCLYMYLC